MRSMTGFGRGEASSAGWRIGVEVSGVNRKQADFAINLPSSLVELESDLRAAVGQAVSRGRVTVRVEVAKEGEGQGSLVFDRDLALRYVDAARELATLEGFDLRIAAADLFRAPGVYSLEEPDVDVEVLKEPIFRSVDDALKKFIEMQTIEGGHLFTDLSSRIDTIVRIVEEIRGQAPKVPSTHRENLFRRLREAGIELDLDDERVLRELALFAEKCDISEELVRIDSHVSQFRTYLASNEPVGRPLDFLCQEFHRELNTIGSKANDAVIAQRVVEAKTELEKVREQVQNVQ